MKLKLFLAPLLAIGLLQTSTQAATYDSCVYFEFDRLAEKDHKLSTQAATLRIQLTGDTEKDAYVNSELTSIYLTRRHIADQLSRLSSGSLDESDRVYLDIPSTCSLQPKINDQK